MQYELNGVYHIYNRGNNKRRIFFSEKNYYYFMKKMKEYLTPVCSVLSWCLMPNHFHLLIHVNEESVALTNHPMPIQRLSAALGKMLSSYTQAINKQERLVGNLFQQGTKKRCTLVWEDIPDEATGITTYAKNVFHYIHRNPLESNLVRAVDDWPFSSFHEYMYSQEDTICDVGLAQNLLNFTPAEVRSEIAYLC